MMSLKMDRSMYKPLNDDCVFTLDYGPYNLKEKTPFMGDNIYVFDGKNPIFNMIRDCRPENTIIDFSGKPKFTLPLSEYNNFTPL